MFWGVSETNGRQPIGEDAAGDSDDRQPAFQVRDRRHWARQDRGDDQAPGEESSTRPTVIDEYKKRAEDAERKLHEYIAAFKESRAEQDAFRARLERDVERRVELRFSEVLSDLIESLDDLDLALSHAKGASDPRPLAEGVALARDRFVAALERHGVERTVFDGREFDPNVAEAIRTDPVDSPDLDGKVTQTLRPGYLLGGQVIRAARVAVGRYEAR
jgi:molecular chaperone GrpE